MKNLTELLSVIRMLDVRAIGVLVRFVTEATQSGDPYQFLLTALDDKLEKERLSRPQIKSR
jgi:hypothetical protein